MATSQTGKWGRRGHPHSTATVLGKLIKLRGVHVYQVGAAIGVDTRTMSYWLNGKKPIPEDKAHKLAEYFGVSMAMILHDQPTINK